MGILEKYNERMAQAQDARDAAFTLAGETFAKAAEAYHAANMAALVAYNAEVEAVGREAREAIHGPSEGHGEPATAVEALCYHEPAPTFTRAPGALPRINYDGIDGVTHVEDYAAPVDAK